MKLEYYGIDKSNLKSGLKISAMSSSNRTKLVNQLKIGKFSNMLDWYNLPDMDGNDLNRIEELSKKYRKMNDFVVLGIGGSALGIKMLKNTFVDSLNITKGTKVTVCDNIDGDNLLTLFGKLNLKKTVFNVITKSGSTSETLTQMLIVIDMYKKKRIDYRKHLIITTTAGNQLWDWAVSEGIEVLSIPAGVGGRFSVLSAVGLLPAGVMGIDIRKLLAGARASRENSIKDDTSNIAYTCAYINYNFLKKGLTNLVMMPYSDRLALLPDFFAQLWAESLGKKYDLNVNEVYTGQTPIKTLGVTDQHSQLQLYSEGIKDKLIMFVRVDKCNYDSNVETELPFTKHLTGTSLHTLMNYEYNATAYSLTTLDRPNYTISIDTVNEECVGELIFMLEMMTAYMGLMLNIDAYDQPGVELSKIYTKAMLGVKIEQDKAKEIKVYMKDKKNFVSACR
ncbi:MAG: glucose-6-phosphate isomerase [Christensenellales bacterium]